LVLLKEKKCSKAGGLHARKEGGRPGEGKTGRGSSNAKIMGGRYGERGGDRHLVKGKHIRKKRLWGTPRRLKRATE